MAYCFRLPSTSSVIPLGQVRPVETTVSRFSPKYVAFSIFGLVPQSVQYITLQKNYNNFITSERQMHAILTTTTTIINNKIQGTLHPA